MNRWERRYLGEERFPKTLSTLEIEHFFTLDEHELASVRERRGPLNRLALALQIGLLKMTGRTLNSVELVPPEILDHLGRQLDCVPPQIASIRAFYRRRHRTLFEHHASALRLLGRSEITPHAERGLVAYLRREATAVFDHAELIARARSWLVEHHYLLLRERDIRRLVIRERTSAGLAAARAEGRVGGRRKKLDAAKRREIAESVIIGRKSGAEMARLYNISQPTVSRIVAQHRKASP
jgi:hypothetical protein